MRLLNEFCQMLRDSVIWNAANLTCHSFCQILSISNDKIYSLFVIFILKWFEFAKNFLRLLVGSQMPRLFSKCESFGCFKRRISDVKLPFIVCKKRQHVIIISTFSLKVFIQLLHMQSKIWVPLIKIMWALVPGGWRPFWIRASCCASPTLLYALARCASWGYTWGWTGRSRTDTGNVPFPPLAWKRDIFLHDLTILHKISWMDLP